MPSVRKNIGRCGWERGQEERAYRNPTVRCRTYHNFLFGHFNAGASRAGGLCLCLSRVLKPPYCTNTASPGMSMQAMVAGLDVVSALSSVVEDACCNAPAVSTVWSARRFAA